ncbi:MAG: signal peptide peptidase SppA [Myxococcaceae bacterium]|nr:signal peptide peptidase SppA [Myxococcaceae bacterium]
MRLAAAVFTLTSSLAFAQVDAVVHTDPSRGITLLPAGTAWAAGSTAPTYNPAGLVHTGMFELFYAHERSLARPAGVGTIGDGLYFGLNPFDFIGAGLSIEWLRTDGVNDFRKTNFSLAIGGAAVSAGIGFNWFSNGPIANAFSVDLGVQTRFSRYFSLGAAIKNVDQPTYGGTVLPRRFSVGAGIRPFREHLTFGVDWILDEQVGPQNSRMSYSLDAKIVSGLHLFGGLSHGFNSAAGFYAQVGLRIDTSHFGIGYAVSGASQGLNHLAFARITVDKAPALPIRDGLIALVDMNGLGETQGTGTVGTLLNVTPADRYVRTAALLDRAAQDRRLKGIVLKVEQSGLGLGRAQELRQAILKLRAAGKQVVALVFSCTDQDYLVASAADRVYAVPEAMLMIDGLRSNVLFFGDTAEKLGVHFDVARQGRYKNSPDQFTRSDMSPEQREAIDAYLDVDARVLEKAVVESRKITPEAWRASVAEGLKAPKRAKELQLIDDIVTPDQLEEKLPELIPSGQLVADYKPFDAREERWGFKSRIAVIPVVGTISGGKDSGDPLGIGLLQSAGADTFIRAIDGAANDPQVAAIVVRVESPGGDGLAADLMYRAVLQAKKKKPVIASMGDVAASGGYYAAMGADEIFASEATITGSIGVFYLKPSVKGLAEKLGVNQVGLSRGELAGLTDNFEPWNEKQREAAQKWIDAFYDSFITEAAQSRKMTKDELHALAQGRVWAGADAKEKGLVDKLGGLGDALESARERTGTQWRDLDIVVYGGSSGGLLGSLLGSSAYGRALTNVEVEKPQPTALQSLAKSLGVELWLMQPGAKAHLGFSLHLD